MSDIWDELNAATASLNKHVYVPVKLMHEAAQRGREQDQRIAELEATFKHTHVAGKGADIDTCAQCGLDLRDSIHKGARG